MPYRGSSLERLQAVIAAQREVMASGLELQRVMDLVAQHARTLTDASAAVVELREGDHMVYRAAAGTATASLGLRLDVYKSLSGLCVLEARTLICTDSEIDPRVDRDASRRVRARSMVCVPLMHEASSIGALKVYAGEPDYFGEDDIFILDQMVGFITAATAFAVAQNEREASDRRFRALAELASDAIISTDHGGTITFCNQSAMRLFGHDKDQLLGASIAQLLPELHMQGLDPGRVLELTGHRAHGHAFPVEVSTSRWTVQDRAALETTYYTFIVRDVTERNVLSQALARQLEMYSALARSLPRGAVIAFDRSLRCVAAEGELLRVLGIHLLDANLVQAAPVQNRDAVDASCQKALTGTSSEVELSHHRLTLVARFAPLHAPDGTIVGGLALMLDITAKRRETLLLRAVAENMPNSAIVVFDHDLRISYAAGSKLAEATHLDANALVGRDIGSLVSPASAAACRSVFQGETYVAELARFGRVFELRALPIHDSSERVVSGLMLVYDVSETRAEAERQRRANLLLDATIANMPDGVAVLDDQRRVLFTNAEFAKLVGLTQSELRGIDPQRFSELVAQRFEDPAELRTRLLTPMDVQQRSGQLVLREPVRRVILHTTKRVGDGSDAGFIVIWRDVTADNDLLAQHKRASMTDPLTGVANRRAAELALESELERHKLTTMPLSVALFDIDHFKRVNDEHGHAMGDVVIQTVARVLAGQARGSDLVARWGGEEFLAILPTSREGAMRFCERVCEAVRKLSWPKLERVTISAGVAECSEHSTTGDLVQTADLKLYEAKAAGRDRVVS